MTTETTKQLEPYTGEFAIFGPEAEEFLDILEENTGSRQINMASIPVWRYPSAEGEEWVFEDETGARHRTPVLTGVVLAQRKERVFYKSKYSGGGEFPDCRSNDGVTGTPAKDADDRPIDFFYDPEGREVKYGGSCATCPLAAWESRRLVDSTYSGSGQACSEYRFGIIQRPDQPTPEGFRLPASALKAWQVFGEQVSRARTRLSWLVIDMRLNLRPKTTTAELQVEAVAYIDKGLSAQMKAIAPDVKRPQLAEAAAPEAALVGAPVDDVPLGEPEVDPADLPF